MIYLKIDDYFEYIFDEIRGLAYDDKQKPDYENQKTGIEKLSGILELIRNEKYYPGFHKKAAYLFASLTTGHIFSNGNKRIALFSYVYFTHRNRYIYRSITVNQYKEWFRVNFPDYEFSDHDFRSNVGWALYNYNKAINIKRSEQPSGHEYNFDQIKEITENFIKFISRKKKR